ncbi:hypothetical protein IWW48_006021 [Coemansia sp. RSA 1200]|nr:hypothetical protein IWW48_006021 [Coemansia sp. RSA 1200]
MSSAETLAVLSRVSKSKVSKRERKTRAKEFIGTCVRRGSSKASSEKIQKTEEKKNMKAADRLRDAKHRPDGDEATRERNIVALRAADKLVSKKSKDLHRDVIELLRAQKEHRPPKLKKQRLTYFDFEDSD